MLEENLNQTSSNKQNKNVLLVAVGMVALLVLVVGVGFSIKTQTAKNAETYYASPNKNRSSKGSSNKIEPAIVKNPTKNTTKTDQNPIKNTTMPVRADQPIGKGDNEIPGAIDHGKDLCYLLYKRCDVQHDKNALCPYIYEVCKPIVPKPTPTPAPTKAQACAYLRGMVCDGGIKAQDKACNYLDLICKDIFGQGKVYHTPSPEKIMHPN